MPFAPRRACGHAPGTGECRACRRVREARRPSRQQRGLDAEYERERRRVLRGATTCETCGQPFGPGRPKTAGHRVARVLGGGTRGNLFPQCGPCNYAEGARLARVAR